MDLKNLLGPPTSSVVEKKQTHQADKPELKKHNSTIDYLVNKDDYTPSNLSSSSPIPNPTKSPVVAHRAPPSAIATPGGAGGSAAQIIKARSSISSLTNDTDVDVDGKITPSIARRLSYEVSASESNSPVLPKKTIPRQASLQDMMNVEEEPPVRFEEPSYKDEAKIDQKSKSIKNSPKTKSTTKKIEDELERLKQLEVSGSNGDTKIDQKKKPKRYAKPPIWATKWVPLAKKDQQDHSANHQNNIPSSSNVEPSITGIKPYNDVTRKITGWIYAQIHSIPKEDRQFLELEVKFGRIWEKRLDQRIHLPVTTEAIIDDSYMLGCTFKTGLEKEHYEKIKKYLTGLTKLDAKKFQTFKFDQVDKQYREASRDQIPKFYRLSFDKATSRIVANIEKRKIASLHIHAPDLSFDYRITLSLELESKENPERFENKTPESERHKRRTSIISHSTATRFDLTEVTQREKGQHNKPVENLEVELEIDTVRLIDAYERLDDDSFTFEDLGQTLMDNSRILNRELLKRTV